MGWSITCCRESIKLNFYVLEPIPTSLRFPLPSFSPPSTSVSSDFMVLCKCFYLSHYYTIGWDRLSHQFLFVCVCICGHAYGRIFQPIFTKFGKNLWGLNRKNWLGWGRNPKMPSPILSPKTQILGAWIGISSQICKNFKSSYFQNYTSD